MKSERARRTVSQNRSRKRCKTLELGLEGFRECPEVGPNTCQFAVPFGYGYLCRGAQSVSDVLARTPRRRQSKVADGPA